MLDIFRTAVMLSDIDFVRWCLENKDVSVDAREYALEELKLYQFTTDDKTFLDHYNHYEGIFYEDERHTLPVPGWADSNPRYQAIKGMMVRHVYNTARVLDFGCAYGQVTRALAKDFPEMQFIGIDHMPEAVSLFNEMAHDLPNCRASVGDLHVNYYDVIIAAEVLEHVRDPYETLKDFKKVLKPNGAIITTLPCGPWEAQGYEENPVGREHLRHWSINEIREVFGQDVRLMFSESGLSKEGLVLGSYVTYSKVKDFGKVDMERKLKAYQSYVELDQPGPDYWMVN